MKFDHVGFIVKDGRKVTDFYDTMLGKAEWKIADYVFPQECMIVGAGFTIRTYNAVIEGIWYEVIEPLEGEGSYFMNCVKDKPGGMHHMAYAFPDEASCVAKVNELTEKGYVIVHASERIKGHRTYYVALPDGSPAIELKV